MPKESVQEATRPFENVGELPRSSLVSVATIVLVRVVPHGELASRYARSARLASREVRTTLPPSGVRLPVLSGGQVIFTLITGPRPQLRPRQSIATTPVRGEVGAPAASRTRAALLDTKA